MASSPGGGGFGDPLDRPLYRVEEDLNLGFISRETAEREYGVVIAEVTTIGDRERFTLDEDASEQERERRRNDRAQAPGGSDA